MKVVGGIIAVCAIFGLSALLLQHDTQPPAIGPFPGDTTPTSAPASPPDPTLPPAGATPIVPAPRSAAQGVPAPAVKGHIFVHVSGQVAQPGLYSLSSDARVADAIAQAGGALPDGDPDALNLAAHLTDGTKLEVPARRSSAIQPSSGRQSSPAQPRSPAAPSSDAPASPSAPSPDAQQPMTNRALLDLNTATSEQLQALPDVGPVLANNIINYRNLIGHFISVEQLDYVKGIGPKKMAELRPYLTVQ